MLREKLSPIDAFKAADKNGDKVISLDELRQAIKTMLNYSEITPADLKMTMVAFDTNRNNLIDENEFIYCIAKARENAPPALGPTPGISGKASAPFSLDGAVSSIALQD